MKTEFVYGFMAGSDFVGLWRRSWEDGGRTVYHRQVDFLGLHWVRVPAVVGRRRFRLWLLR